MLDTVAQIKLHNAGFKKATGQRLKLLKGEKKFSWSTFRMSNAYNKSYKMAQDVAKFEELTDTNKILREYQAMQKRMRAKHHANTINT